MGIIATITPGSQTRKIVPKKLVTNEEIRKAGNISIHYYGPPEDSKKVLYKELKNLKVADPLKNLDILWKVSHPTLKSPRTGWLGTM